ncbi:hypothetical protein CSAL01_01510 [Colletotrichum salicis]|uniref:Uncharacterized protein n=1 Tax=Colletotrichum salicis TaxID=1209931 RepID=A0A135V580_9PEZI|nr:hypothetical protein CSAL01_01510 [Colletotrichum salicis]
MERLKPEEIQPWIRASPDALRCFSAFSFRILKKYIRAIGLVSDLQTKVSDSELQSVEIYDTSDPSVGPKFGVTSETTSLGWPMTQKTTLALLRLLVEARAHRSKVDRLHSSLWWDATLDQQLWDDECRLNSMFVDLFKRSPGNRTTEMFMAMFEDFIPTGHSRENINTVN